MIDSSSYRGVGLLFVVVIGGLAPWPPSIAFGGSPQVERGQEKKPVEPIDFNRARELLQKRRTAELTPEEAAYLRRAMEARQKQEPKTAAGGRPGQVGPDSRALLNRDKTGLKPLDEMTAADRYEGQDGGLYGDGKNAPPEAQRRAAEAALKRIRPLDAEGKPAADGRVVLVSISMSNATQEFSTFKQIADRDPQKSPLLTIVDCAQGGQAMAEWVSPEASPWLEADRRIASAHVTAPQVQVAWIKLANKGPRGSLEEHGRKLQRDTLAVIHNAKSRFPNLQIAYLSSRIFGGYTRGPLNPEPYAYESAFPVRWLIQDQVRGVPDLNPDPAAGSVKSPVLLWGPYLWADGVTPRQSDKLVWQPEDLGPDGTHPSIAGRQKVANLLLQFFKSDPYSTSWFTR